MKYEIINTHNFQVVAQAASFSLATLIAQTLREHYREDDFLAREIIL